MNIYTRFENYVIHQGDCWIWQKLTFDFWDGKANVRPHRWAYLMKNGHVPKILKNTCGISICANPDHYFTPNELFWMKLRKTHRGCWEYTGFKTHNGYGYISRKNIERLSHRLAWHLTFGPIPKGLCVLHKCDNPACCKPEHLFLGTAIDNMNDKFKKGRDNSPIGEDSGVAKLTDSQVIEIHKRAAKGHNIKALSEEFGITDAAIYMITSGKNWKHIGLKKIKFKARGERNARSKLNETIVRESYNRVKNGETVTAVAKSINIAVSTLSEVINGNKWKHLGLEPLNIGYALGSRTNTAKLDEQKVKEIRSLPRESIDAKQLAKTYGVSIGTINKVLSGRTWKHVK